MTTTFIGILITALAIKFDEFTLFRHNALPPIALAGVLTIIGSLIL